LSISKVLSEFKPYQIIVFILIVGAFLTPIILLNPDGKLNLGLFELDFISKNEILHPKKQEIKDISKIVAFVDTTGLDYSADDELSSEISEDVPKELIPKIQSVKKTKIKKTNTSKKASRSNLINETSALFLNDLALEKLHNFFNKLVNVTENQEKIHILHYGDSQIEGDRMTAYIRQRIQNQFGGNGPGLIPSMNVYVTNTFKQTYSSNFSRYTCFGGEKLSSKKYGVMGAVSKFKTDSINSEAWIEIESSSKAQSRARYYNQVKLFYTDCRVKCKVKVFHNNLLVLDDSLLSDGNYHVLPLQFSGKVGKLKFVFSSKESPTFCGLSLEGNSGVQVDNIGMRGCSGTFFNSLERSTFKSMLNDLNSELIILQFGGNSVPHFKDSVGVRRYAKFFQSQIKTIKQINPSAAIIVIGPSDMSKLSDGIYETYKFLPYCVTQMKKAAASEGAGYWDLYKAMGGMNSMPSWVETGLAGRDYIHFTNKGASIASQLFYDAIELEFSNWKAQQ